MVRGKLDGTDTMKILVLADLHLDEITDRYYLRHLGEAIRDAGAEAEAMIIAGDLTEAAAERWPKAIRWLGTLYPSSKTVILPGNHDYYRGNLSFLDGQLAAICRKAGCGFGQCMRLDFGNVRVLMTTLWTDMRLFEGIGEDAIEESIWQASQMMPDYGYDAIMVGDPERQLCPEDTAEVHEKQKTWLTSELARPWHGRTVVVTHHAPSGSVTGQLSPLSPCFASNFEAEIERYRPDVWLFGHTHRPAEAQMQGGTLLRNVSVGYEVELTYADVAERVQRGLLDLSTGKFRGIG